MLNCGRVAGPWRGQRGSNMIIRTYQNVHALRLQQDHFFIRDEMRLPAGYSSVSADFGTQVHIARKARKLKQAALAADVGICRETLLRIEKGQQGVRLRVLYALAEHLELELETVLDRGPPACPSLIFEEGRRGDMGVKIGANLHDRRIAQELSLRVLATRLGISAAQLSRLERGQSPNSRHLSEVTGDLKLDREDRRLNVSHRKLRNFLDDCPSPQ